MIYGRAEEDSLISYQPFVQTVRAALDWGVVPQDPDALAGIVPDLAHGRRLPSPTTPEAASRLRMFEAACDVFDIAAAERPLLLALDDLHWADEPTLRLLAHLARRPQPAPVLLLGAYRQTELRRGRLRWPGCSPILGGRLTWRSSRWAGLRLRTWPRC